MKNKYNFVIEEKAAFQKTTNIIDGWDWSFKEHVRLSFLYKNSQFSQDNSNRDKRPFNNIVRPILNVQYRTEGFDVKDIELYVKNIDISYKSLLVKKFHEDWALENRMDTFIDDVVESYVDYGGVLVRNVNEVRPEVVDLKTIAFCDQTNLLGGPFAIRHNMSPDDLRAMEKSGWGDSGKGATIDIETLIKISENNQENDRQKNSTPGKYIEVFELHGTLPENWLNRSKDEEDSKYINQVQIIAFYKNKDDQDIGVTLFAAKEPKLPFKLLLRDKIQGRALGFGGIEELFESQVWTNYNEVQMREMLELASKVFFKSTDSRFKTRNNIANRDTGTVFDLQTGTDIGQLDTTPRNIAIFDNAVQKWERRAQTMGGASELMLNEAPSSGTPFKSVEAQLVEGHSLHQWRQGKIATFIEEIYREWILPYISSEIAKGHKFLADLSMDELGKAMNAMVKNHISSIQKERVLNGELPMNPEEKSLEEQSVREQILERGQEQPMEILKDEFSKEDLGVYANIVGKQKNLALIADKVTNVIREFIANPQIRQDPEMLRLTNEVLEASGLSPIMFAPSALPAQMSQQIGTPESKMIPQPA